LISSFPPIRQFTVPTARQCREWIRATEGGVVFLLHTELTPAQQVWIYQDLLSESREVEHCHVPRVYPVGRARRVA